MFWRTGKRVREMIEKRRGGRNTGGFIRDGGSIEGEDCTKGSGGLIVWVGLRVRVGVDDERGADSGEQAGLQG